MNSLRSRLMAGVLISLALALGGAGFALHRHIRRAIVTEFDTGLLARADGLRLIIEQTRKKVDFDFKDKFIPEFQPGPAADYFHLSVVGGDVVAHSASLGEGSLSVRTERLDEPEFGNITLPDGRPGRAVGIRFIPRLDLGKRVDEPPPDRVTLILAVATSRERLDTALISIQSGFLLIGGISLAVSVMFIAWSIKRSLRPLGRVAEQAAAISEHSLDVRFPIAGMPRELHPICNRLNELMSRLECAFARESRFSADIAHELRTPLAELRTLCEVAIKWPGDPAACASSFRDALGISARMESLVTGLLTIARTEQGRQPVIGRPVDVSALLREVWDSHAHRAVDKNIAATVEIADGIQFTTDAALLRVVLDNLADNALEYTPAGGVIRITASDANIQIANTNTNITAVDLPHLFDRFWRKDAARDSARHAGLGLSLSQAAARVLGYTIEATCQQKGMIIFTIRPAFGASSALDNTRPVA